MLWLAFHLMRGKARTEPPPRTDAPVSNVSALRLPVAPAPVPEPVKEEPKEDRYAQLMAYLSERFAAYDKLLQRPALSAPSAPEVSSVIFDRSRQRAGARGAADGGDASSFAAPLAGASDSAGTPQAEGLAAAFPALGDQKSERGVDDLLKPSVMKAEKAAKMTNRSFLLAQGSNLECVLETAIDTTVPGMTTCILSRDIYSDDSRVLLLEKGSKLVGEYRGSLQMGDERLFVIWSRIVTPMGVAIRLNSPGTDVLGRAGVSGYVDNRYFERFGTALLVSILADAMPPVVRSVTDKLLFESGITEATGAASTGGPSATQSAGNQMGQEIIRQSALVPPVLRKNQGDRVSILVSRDLDFSSVYSLALRR